MYEKFKGNRKRHKLTALEFSDLFNFEFFGFLFSYF